MKTKRIKAEKIYEVMVGHKFEILTRERKGHYEPRLPRWMLPATPEAYRRMVEQVATTLWSEGNPAHSWFTFGKPWQDGYRQRARAVLRTLGITCPKQKS